jgi:Protein of unknown function (DUF4058)
VLVSRSEQRPTAQLYPFDLRDELPCFTLPLRGEDEPPVVDLHRLMQTVYESAALDLTIDYRQPPTPPLTADQLEWAQAIGANAETDKSAVPEGKIEPHS